MGAETGLLAPPASQPASHPCHLWHCLEKRLLAQFRDSLKAPKRSCFCGLMPYQQLKQLPSSQNFFVWHLFVATIGKLKLAKAATLNFYPPWMLPTIYPFYSCWVQQLLLDVQFSPGFVEGFLLSLGASTKKNNKWLFLGSCVLSKDLWWSLTSKKNTQFKVILG